MILAFLQDREQKGDCQPEIKDVQFINAEVIILQYHMSSLSCSLKKLLKDFRNTARATSTFYLNLALICLVHQTTELGKINIQ